MENELAIRNQVNLTPAEIVENSTTQAKLLMDIVEQTKCYQEISGKKYLQVEAWETIGAFNRTHAETESVTPIIRDNEVIGYQAHVKLWKDGVIVGGAVMPCYFTENCCRGKEGDAKHKASMSAAQTFATSKAYRMNYSYVAILAGYQPLPAEEVTEDMKQESVDKTLHWCKLHDTAFFKKGKMRGHAHPIGDTGEWCHEHLSKEKVDKRGEFEKEGRDLVDEAMTNVKPHSLAVTTKSEPPLEESKEVEQEEAETTLVIDMDKLKTDLNTLDWVTCGKWLNDHFKVTGRRISDIVKKLTPDQQREFAAEIENRLEMS